MIVPAVLPEPANYEERVNALEAEGCTRSDAQGIVDAEVLQEWRGKNTFRAGDLVYVWDLEDREKVEAVYVRLDGLVHIAKPVFGLMLGRETDWQHAALRES
jgi:hypothetical protein